MAGGKVAVVTGSAMNIGRAIALALARDGHRIMSGWFGILEDHRTGSCDIPRYIKQVFDREGNASERAWGGSQFALLVEVVGGGPRRLCCDFQKGALSLSPWQGSPPQASLNLLAAARPP